MDLAKIRKKAKAAAAPAKPGTPRAEAMAEALSEGQAAKAPRADEPATKHEPGTAPEATIQEAAAPESIPQVQPVQAPASQNLGEQAPEAVTRHVEKLLIFKLSKRRYAIPISDVSQIIEARPATPIPHSPDYVKGIFSLRGRIVLVLDGAARLGLGEDGAGEGAKVVVLDLGEELFGLYAHAIEQVVEVDLSSLEPPPESFLPMEQEFVEGVFHHRDRSVALLNLPLFLDLDSSRRTT